MNKVILVGRLTKDPEIKVTQSDKSTCSFTLAVARPSKERTADFILCVAWEKTAELIARYLSKGSRVGIVGAIQTRNWEGADGKRVYVTEVLVNQVEFIDTKKDASERASEETETLDDTLPIPFDL